MDKDSGSTISSGSDSGDCGSDTETGEEVSNGSGSQHSDDLVWFIDHCKEVYVSPEDDSREDLQYEKELLGEDSDEDDVDEDLTCVSPISSSSSSSSAWLSASSNSSLGETPRKSVKRKLLSDSSGSDEPYQIKSAKKPIKSQFWSSSSDSDHVDLVDNHFSGCDSDSDNVCTMRKRKNGSVIPLVSSESE